MRIKFQNLLYSEFSKLKKVNFLCAKVSPSPRDLVGLSPTKFGPIVSKILPR